MDIQEKIDVLVACRDGKAIEMKNKNSDFWDRAPNPPCFNFNAFDYRVKKEPEVVYLVGTKDSGFTQFTRYPVNNFNTIIKKYVEVLDE